MKTIWKYKLKTSAGSIEIPVGAKVLTCQMQGDSICLWVEIDCHQKDTEMRVFDVFGTGESISDDMDVNLVYVGTVQHDGKVGHVYERVR